MTHYNDKMKMIKDILKNVNKKKKQHYKKWKKLNKLSSIIKASVNGLNAISVSSLVLALTPASPIFMIVALTSTSISSIVSAVSTAYELENKVQRHQTSYLQYADIYRDISARILRSGLSSEDLDVLLVELNVRLGLIEDNSPPLEKQKSTKNNINMTM